MNTLPLSSLETKEIGYLLGQVFRGKAVPRFFGFSSHLYRDKARPLSTSSETHLCGTRFPVTNIALPESGSRMREIGLCLRTVREVAQLFRNDPLAMALDAHPLLDFAKKE
jgi:hypothetical protein